MRLVQQIARLFTVDTLLAILHQRQFLRLFSGVYPSLRFTIDAFDDPKCDSLGIGHGGFFAMARRNLTYKLTKF
jgi:hypothetical protein